MCAFTERFGCEIRIIEIVKKYMDIGNTIEISDQNFYLRIVFFRSGHGLLDPKFRLMTHIRRYGGPEINFKKTIFLSKNNYVPHGHEKSFGDHVAHNYFSIKISILSKIIFF